MAAVMVGGMVAPFATAIATTFFKNKFTEDERRAGVSNWILGFSFITEGLSHSPVLTRCTLSFHQSSAVLSAGPW